MEWEFSTRPINELIPQRRNPRKLSARQRKSLRESIERFGLAEPIVISKEGGIIGGHQRLSLMREAGHQMVDCMQAKGSLTKKEIEELSIRLNKNTGSFDIDSLASDYNLSDLLSYGFDISEFSLEENPEDTNARKSFKITVKLASEEDLNEVEKEIAKVLDRYKDASYKVRII